jgi:hypothetical protein
VHEHKRKRLERTSITVLSLAAANSTALLESQMNYEPKAGILQDSNGRNFGLFEGKKCKVVSVLN